MFTKVSLILLLYELLFHKTGRTTPLSFNIVHIHPRRRELEPLTVQDLLTSSEDLHVNNSTNYMHLYMYGLRDQRIRCFVFFVVFFTLTIISKLNLINQVQQTVNQIVGAL